LPSDLENQKISEVCGEIPLQSVLFGRKSSLSAKASPTSRETVSPKTIQNEHHLANWLTQAVLLLTYGERVERVSLSSTETFSFIPRYVMP
jgi:hypothetical protein